MKLAHIRPRLSFPSEPPVGSKVGVELSSHDWDLPRLTAGGGGRYGNLSVAPSFGVDSPLSPHSVSYLDTLLVLGCVSSADPESNPSGKAEICK